MSSETFENDQLIYRQAKENDLSKIMAFADICLRRDVLIVRGYIKNYLKSSSKIWLVFDKDKLIAFAFIWKKTNSLNNLYIHPKYRNRKIGLNLMNYLKPKFVRSKLDQSTGDPTEFYKKTGYELIGEKQGKKKNLNILKRIEK